MKYDNGHAHTRLQSIMGPNQKVQYLIVIVQSSYCIHEADLGFCNINVNTSYHLFTFSSVSKQAMNKTI